MKKRKPPSQRGTLRNPIDLGKSQINLNNIPLKVPVDPEYRRALDAYGLEHGYEPGKVDPDPLMSLEEQISFRELVLKHYAGEQP